MLTTTTTTILQPFVRDYPRELVPEGYTILDFAEAEMIWVAVADNDASTSPVRFLQARCLS